MSPGPGPDSDPWSSLRARSWEAPPRATAFIAIASMASAVSPAPSMAPPLMAPPALSLPSHSRVPNNDRSVDGGAVAFRRGVRTDAPFSSACRSDSSACTSAGSKTEGSTRSDDGPSGTSDGSCSTHCSVRSRSAHGSSVDRAGAASGPDGPSATARWHAGWGSIPIDHSFRTAQTFGLAAVWWDITLTPCGPSRTTSQHFNKPLPGGVVGLGKLPLAPCR